MNSIIVIFAVAALILSVVSFCMLLNVESKCDVFQKAHDSADLKFNSITKDINSTMQEFNVFKKQLDNYFDATKDVVDSCYKAVMSNDSEITSAKRDYMKMLTDTNDIYSHMEDAFNRISDIEHVLESFGYHLGDKKEDAVTPMEIDFSEEDPDLGTNLGPFGPREWPRDMVVDALNNASDNENSDEPRDRVVNAINNIDTSPTFYSKEEMKKFRNPSIN